MLRLPRPRESPENCLPHLCEPCWAGAHDLCRPVPYCECLDRTCTQRLEDP